MLTQRATLVRGLADLAAKLPAEFEWQATNVLDAAGMRRFVPDGAAFDPAVHHVVDTQPTPDAQLDDTVARTLRPGWEDRGQVMVPARVVLYARPDGPPSGPDDAGADDGPGPGDIDPGRLRQLERLRARLTAEARQAGRDDLLALLDDRPAAEATAPICACVVGATKVGKSRLLNALVGRPLLSPVGVDITTSCWLEVGYGESDSAEVIVADPDSLAHPIRRPCGLDELERYVALGRSREPVIGVRVRLRQPALHNLLLVDTPGVNGLVSGHTASTLAALRTADALLFVCDSGQPILAPELAFLVEAARRVPTVVVAVTKRDLNPEYARIVADTRQRIAATRGLGDVPVLAVAAPLADRAADTADPGPSRRLRRHRGSSPCSPPCAATAPPAPGWSGSATRRGCSPRCAARWPPAPTRSSTSSPATPSAGSSCTGRSTSCGPSSTTARSSAGRSASALTGSAGSRRRRSATPSRPCGAGTARPPSGARRPSCRPWPTS